MVRSGMMRAADLGGRPRFVAEMIVCPRCGSTVVEPLGRVRSALEWHQCGQCRHVWPERQLTRGSDQPDPAADATACAKCGKIEARVIGRSSEFVYCQCAVCGHTSVKSGT